MRIVAEHLSYTYNERSPFETAALHDVTLTIEEGEFFGIIGHTGSGKTTFVQHLNALIRLQSGSLTVGDIDLTQKKTDLKRLRGMVGMVFQYPEYQLFANTVEEDIAFGPKNIGVDKEKIETLVKDSLELVGMPLAVLKKSPFDLSGGEKRRVALAGVLAMQPKVLVLDEPTAGLDPNGKREILSLVKKLNREKGITVIMVSHDMNEVFENVDRVIVFNQGQVVHDLPPRELFRKQQDVEGMNLEVPYVAQFLNALESHGVVLNQDIRTVDEAFVAVNALKGGSK